MHTKRFKVAITLALALLLVVVLSAFAAPDATPERVSIRLRDATIPWFFPPPEGLNGNVCPGVPVGYEVNPDDNGSNRRKRALVQEMANGGKRIRTWDVVTGTATDNFGNTYTFVYRNNATVIFKDGIGTVKVSDYFILRGDAFTHKLGFKWSWQYTGDSLNLTKAYDGDGNLVDFWADFATWPTDDGLTETTNPAMVPGSWQVFYDYGDPWLCDPI